jgi:hypothetical protein
MIAIDQIYTLLEQSKSMEIMLLYVQKCDELNIGLCQVHVLYLRTAIE